MAYALMQDQLNKIIKPAPAPVYDFYPPPSQAADQASAQDSQPQTTAEEAPASEEPAAEKQAPDNQTVASSTASETDAQIETVKKLKALLDAGILTEEEFEAKKKQVLGL